MTRLRPRGPLISSVVLRSQSDAVLTGLAADGHQLAFKMIFQRYERELRVHAARVVRPSRVDDVLQHAMLNAWSALLAGRSVEQLRPWLHRIVHTTALNTLSRRGYDDGALPEAVAAPSLTADLAEGRITAVEALTAIAALPTAQREALVLTALEGQSAKSAAAEMGLSEGAVRQLVFRARAGVRTAVSAITPLPLLLMRQGGGGGAAIASSAATGSLGGGAIAVKAVAVLALTAGTVGTVEHRQRAGERPAHQATARRASGRAPLASQEPASTTMRPAVVAFHVAAPAGRTSARALPGEAAKSRMAPSRSTHAADAHDAAGSHGVRESDSSRDDRGGTGTSGKKPDPARSGDSIASAPDSESSTDATPNRSTSVEERAPVGEPRSDTGSDGGGVDAPTPPAALAEPVEAGT